MIIKSSVDQILATLLFFSIYQVIGWGFQQAGLFQQNIFSLDLQDNRGEFPADLSIRGYLFDKTGLPC